MRRLVKLRLTEEPESQSVDGPHALHRRRSGRRRMKRCESERRTSSTSGKTDAVDAEDGDHFDAG